MKKGRVTLIMGIVVLYMSTFLVINTGLSEGAKSGVSPTISSQQQAENERKVAETELEESVKSIFFEIVKKNKLDANAFTLKVANLDDGPDW